MNIENLPIVKDMAEFLAHAELLVQESHEWYSQLADSMEQHNNQSAAAQFRALESMEEQQLHWLAEQAKGLTLPKIAPWDFAWDIYQDSNKTAFSDIHYLTSQADALAAALEHEQRAENLYRQVAAQSPEAKVQKIATDMAIQQVEQINLLKTQLAELPEESSRWLDDLDPPNLPG